MSVGSGGAGSFDRYQIEMLLAGASYYSDVKHNKGFTRSSRLGQAACQAEWALHHIAKNLQGWTRRRATAPPTGPDDTDPGPNRSTDLYGTGKQGARFGYTGVRGYHPLLATLASTGEVLHSRMRGGNAGAARGAGSFVRETCRRIRGAGATGKLTFRADSAFYSRAFVTACQDHDVAFSVTVDENNAIRRAIGQIDDDAWVPIPYWLDGGGDVAETTYTAFKGTTDHVGLRLIVRRVRPTPCSQLALDVVFDYHAILTDRDGSMLEVEDDHRAHAVVELAIRDLKAGGLAHVPSGIFTANAAWLALAVLAHNLARGRRRTGRGAKHSTALVRIAVIPAPTLTVHHRGRSTPPSHGRHQAHQWIEAYRKTQSGHGGSGGSF